MVTKRRSNEDEDEQPQGSKRHQTLEAALREATGGSSGQEFLQMLVFCVRKVVREELDLRILPYAQPSHRPSLNHVEAIGSRGWQLVFRNRLPNIIFTGSRIVAEGNTPVEVALLDATSKHIVRTGPLSSIKVEILVLDGDFGTDEQEDWSAKEFDECVIREREGKKPLVIGELFVTLKDGVGYLADITFTDNSSWIRSRKFKLGARAVRRSCNKERIGEARTGAFVVKDHRGQGYQKHYPPSQHDEVWRLEKIRKDGVYHQRLTGRGIATVQDFLRLWVTDPSSLRAIFESGMTKKWDAVIQHARTCNLDNRKYIYSAPELKLVFNSIYELIGVTFDGHNYLDNFTTYQMNLVEYWKQHAYKHLDEMEEINCSPANVPPITLPLEAASAPEPSLDVQLSNIQITHQDQPTHMGYDSSSYQLPHVSDDHYQLDEVALQVASQPIEEFFPFQRNSITLTGSSSRNAVTDEHFTGYDDFSQVHTPNWLQFATTLGVHNELFRNPNYETGFDFIPDVSVRINKSCKSRTGWFKIRAAVKFLCQKKSKTSAATFLDL